MNELTMVTKFSGGGGVDLGAIAAGWDHLYGIEYDDNIAQVARDNGLNTITADILEINPADYPGMTWMHDSPPCPNFSTAKAGGEETENDIALAQAVCDWIVYHRPQFYTLENVYGYRKSKSWAMIADTLTQQGYSFNFWHVNFANYGTIERCPIHHVLENTGKNAQYAEMYLSHASRMTIAQDIVQESAGMLTSAQARILAWNAVAELGNLIPLDIVENVTLRELAKRLQKTSGERITITGKVESELTSAVMLESSITTMAQDTQENTDWLLKKLLVESLGIEKLSIISTEILQITAQKILRCLLTIPNTSPITTKKQTNQKDGTLVTSGHSCPLCQEKGIPQTRKRMIVIARLDGKTPALPPKTHAETPTPGLFGTLERWVSWYEAIEDLIPTLPDSQFAPWQLERLPDEYKNTFLMEPTTMRNGGVTVEKKNPLFTLKAQRTLSTRAFIMNAANPNGNEKRKYRNTDFYKSALPNGRVVKMTPRALARFQSFPDWYELPTTNTLAARIIGNAVPPLFMKQVGEMLKDT